MFVAPKDVDIAIVGASCRLPGAKNRLQFNNLIASGLNSVAKAPTDRWNVGKLLHPNPLMPGFSYTFAGGYLDDLFDFDPTVFGMSPREAMEADPQQRLLLETVYEALEDAWIPRSTLRGADVGVYVGASSLDHGSIMAADPSAIDRYFMTGNTLSVVSNRLSHNFDWRGPSYTVDTACSSSMVALVQAMSDLAAGRVETAVVAGVNVLLNPMSFVGFSRASMLSPTGLCRPFSKEADGYVRSEGAVALVLRRGDCITPGSARAWVVAGGMNNDGRTSGIALPSMAGQAQLLEDIYGGMGIAPDQLAFMEAHGTGTQVGDAVEATALGTALGQKRSSPLPVGSVKSNLGHLEPASGIAGILKALYALETRRLPQSLHLDALNPHIDFDAMGIQPAATAMDLAAEGDLLCGVSSFGFGGTNAHVILRSPQNLVASDHTADHAPHHLVVSAASREALLQSARSYADLVAVVDAPEKIARAVDAARDPMPYRLVVPVAETATVVSALRSFADDMESSAAFEGLAPSETQVCFAFSGNGTLTVDLTRAAFRQNAIFRAKFRQVAAIFRAETGEELEYDLFEADYEERKSSASFLQPLMFAFHYSIAESYIAAGIKPDVVLGHSFGEISAACIAGAITVEEAAKIIAVRAACQERLRGKGGMAVFAASVDDVAALMETLDLPSLEIAADNGPSSATVTGEVADVKALIAAGRRKRLAGRMLDLQYPFHSKLLDPLEPELLAGLTSLTPKPPHTPLISKVTGALLGEGLLDAHYWWGNFRKPVAFRQAVEVAHSLGANLFIEISQRPILISAIGQTLSAIDSDARAITSLQPESASLQPESDSDINDPMMAGIGRAIANGATTGGQSTPLAFLDRTLALPHYSWQKRTFHFEETSERLNIFGSGRSHPLIGERLFKGSHEWRGALDSTLVPYLADHVVDGEVVVPGSAIVEMMLAVGRALHENTALCLEDLDVLQAMTLPTDNLREVCIRHTPATGMIEILSRFHLGAGDWTINARGRLAPAATILPWPEIDTTNFSVAPVEEVYRLAVESGMQYGPAFRRLQHVLHEHWTVCMELEPVENDASAFKTSHILHPASMDACFHALFYKIENDSTSGRRRSYLPIRFGRITVVRDNAAIASAVLKIDAKTEQWLLVSVTLHDRDGAVVARLDRVLLRSVVLSHGDDDAHLLTVELWRNDDIHIDTAWLETCLATRQSSDHDEGRALLEAHMRSVAYDALLPLCNQHLRLDLDDAVARNVLAADALIYARALLTDLAAVGLAQQRDDGAWQLPKRSGLPEAGRILATFMADFPTCTPEILLAAGTMAEIETCLKTGKAIPHRDTVIRQFAAGTLLLKPAIDGVDAILTGLMAQDTSIKPRIVISASHSDGLFNLLAPLAASHRIRLAIAGKRMEDVRHAAMQLPQGCAVQFIDVSDAHSVERCGPFDLALIGMSAQKADIADLARPMSAMLSPSGALLVAQMQPSALVDFYFGTQPHWFAAAPVVDAPISRPAYADDLLAELASAGVTGLRRLQDANLERSMIVARRQHVVRPSLPGLHLLHQDDCRLAEALRAGLPIADDSTDPDQADTLCLLVSDDLNQPDALRRLTALAIDAVKNGGGRLWFITSAAFGADVRPVSEAIWSLCRVLANEHPERDIHLLDYHPQIESAALAAKIAEVLAHPGREREIHLDAAGMSVVRIVPSSSNGDSLPQALALKLPGGRGIADLAWQPVARKAPEPDEIEVEVMATGLNFRDVMLAMGLLYDDVLDGGAAGAVLGFECAGRVIGVGAGTHNLAIGDMVCGVASEAFATHVTAPHSNFIKIPEGISPQQAATIPVAFLTAWYGLIEMARLKAGETVLIHGAAGGVGLAALQLAKARGAKVIATVSTADKRALVQLLGADTVYDSRSMDFHGQVNTVFGGVDVILNSLAGDAMRASLKCLKPFGRFIELGKRDYIANTEIGLRPFRRNLSYFGVDVDQLLASHPKVAARGLAYVLKGFQAGKFMPLPSSVFQGEFAADAMRLMQGAGHIGKIVICPPQLATQDTAIPDPVTPFAPQDGVQLIVGGTGGFGFATAQWLAQKGARHIVLASRSGKLAPQEQALATSITDSGATLQVMALDVTHAAQVEALVEHIARTIGPISGVYHAAVVLHDGFATHLSPEQIENVLSPKVEGTVNLDQATRSQPVRDFVMFSSEAALVGNPGQSTYAAANAFMHGIMRKRRREGLPALAVGWGAVSDVGILARESGVARKLERATGAQGIRSEEAHRFLDGLLSRQSSLKEAVVYFGRMRFDVLARDLLIVQSPAFSLLFRPDSESENHVEGNLLALLAQKPQDEAIALLTSVIITEVADILRIQASDVDVHQPLSSLGLDSLMALELRMSLESKFGLELPLMAITSVQNLKDLGTRMFEIMQASSIRLDTSDDGLQDALYHMHVGTSANVSDEMETIH
ncbi:acyl transferase domain-containing protein/NADPH:quinone reductase-like Zn-dependent oxidoreductase/acyl carrier protein [Agrobacterium vitis]|nr:acyl transferase domain-containing protein/NADPH:quinone reductase-like Zn-dependent oxidoreductase/acyl carrier protein [Agrobacterium vitis]MBE1436551.1 acyl transferase domain-containing protein/NADPH:quinone reductase-like Zn-dependent oxidoreductase/acyl carrier protein [Agrobacterium vitis]